MAQSTIDDDIARIEAELTNLRVKIGLQEALREQEEGGAGSRFRTQYTIIDVLYTREERLQTKLDTLYASKRLR